ncbi:hypothetical protein C5167_035622 [Papaver somniferum]|uniref:Uncharacterized protein n=1 Tax=Papaver somniferum TaxID=3469 RepID=A0A4Y7KHS8_PAPSO|nr:protein KOKOPELLI-like isoform X2 [Papaver somniferum]RZC72417.1 hypothetical protein C5167_035622 [Papaver somniferum]
MFRSHPCLYNNFASVTLFYINRIFLSSSEIFALFTVFSINLLGSFCLSSQNFKTQNREEFKMGKIEIIASLLEGLSNIRNVYQLQQNELDENENVVLKGILDTTATQVQMVQSHMKKTVADRSQQQDSKIENKVCHKCGKFKKLEIEGAKVITELDVIRRFKAGNPRGNQVLSQDRDEILCQAIKRKFRNPQRTTSPPLLDAKVESVGSREMISCQQREQEPTEGIMQPTTLSGMEVTSIQDWIANSHNQRNRRSTGSSSTPADDIDSYTSSEELDYPPQRTEQLDRHRIYRSISRSRSPQSKISCSDRSYTSYDPYDSSPEEEYLVEYPVARGYTSYDSYDSSPEEECPDARSYTSYDSYDSSPEEEYPDARSYKSYDSYDSFSEEEYPVARRSRFSKKDPPQKKMGHVKRLTTKLVGMFRRDHHEDTGASPSKEDRNAGDHHVSIQKPVGNGKLHHEIKGKHMPVQTRRTTKVEDKASHQQGHFRPLVKGFVGHVFSLKKSKPSSSGVRQLEKAVTGKEKITAKKRHWWQSLRRQGLPNKRGKALLTQGYKKKHTQLKGRHRHAK